MCRKHFETVIRNFEKINHLSKNNAENDKMNEKNEALNVLIECNHFKVCFVIKEVLETVSQLLFQSVTRFEKTKDYRTLLLTL